MFASLWEELFLWGPPQGCCVTFFVDVNAVYVEVCEDLLGLLLMLLAATPPLSELEVNPLKSVIHSPSDVD